MSDTIDDYKALAEFRKQERAARRAAAEAKLQGLNYSVHNGGAHIVIWEGGAIFDYWPGTDRWRMRNFRSEEGVEKMLAAIRERKIITMDLSKIEERVVAMMPAHAHPYGLQQTPKDDPFLVTTGALFKGSPTGRIVDNTPPWQELPSTPEEDEAYVDKMEKAYPHLNGPDEKP